MVVEGPGIIKMLVPCNLVVPLPNAMVPVNWTKHKEETGGPAKQLPMFEVELDCIAEPNMRKLAGVLFKNLKSMVVDVAIVIQKEGEPSACLSMFRFDRIDIRTCPSLPVRQVSDEEAYRLVDEFLAGRPV